MQQKVTINYLSIPYAMITAAIFDVDGTLVDSVDAHARAWVEAFARFGRVISFEEMRHEIGKGGDQLLPDFLSSKEIERIGKSLETARAEIFKSKYLSTIHGFPKVRELFQRLAAEGKRIALASSAKEDELQAYKEAARITDLVEEATSKDDAAHSKPHPDIFAAALRRLKGVERDEVLVVGDSPYDSIAAVKAGLKIIGVLSGGFSVAELRGAGCLEVYHSVADLLAHYETSLFATS